MPRMRAATTLANVKQKIKLRSIVTGSWWRMSGQGAVPNMIDTEEFVFGGIYMSMQNAFNTAVRYPRHQYI